MKLLKLSGIHNIDVSIVSYDEDGNTKEELNLNVDSSDFMRIVLFCLKSELSITTEGHNTRAWEG